MVFLKDNDYKNLIVQIKNQIKQSRFIALRRVNYELINLYYNIGKQIYLKQQDSNWGDDLIGQIERDLKIEFPDLKGFSRSNLFYMKKCYSFFKKEKVPPLVGQIENLSRNLKLTI